MEDKEVELPPQEISEEEFRDAIGNQISSLEQVVEKLKNLRATIDFYQDNGHIVKFYKDAEGQIFPVFKEKKPIGFQIYRGTK